MRILVVSDTHGRWGALYNAILAQPTAEVVIHLGDGIDDLERLRSDFPDKMLTGVCGNCDFGRGMPAMDSITIEGKKIFYTHGHIYGVKGGLEKLEIAARERGADICLFGHTHQAYTDYRNGLYIMNPGSLGCPRDRYPSYGYIDIVNGGVMPVKRELRS